MSHIMKNQKVNVSQFFSTKICEAFRAIFPRKCRENDGGFEFGPAHCGPVSVSEHVMTKQDCTKIEHFVFSAKIDFYPNLYF